MYQPATAQTSEVTVPTVLRQDRQFPDRIDPLEPRPAWPDTRELIIAVTPFLVVYRVEPRRVIVQTVLHGARRWPRSQP